MKKGHTYIRKLTEQQKQEAVRMYEGGKSTYQIGAVFGLHDTSVGSLLRRRGVVMRTLRESNRRLPFNEAAFDSVTPEAAYWIGMLMADGNVCARKHSTYISLALGTADAGHVERFRAFLGSSHQFDTQANNRGYANGKGLVRLSVASRRLADRLSEFGVVPAKSATAAGRGLEFDRDFWRGVVDGDGFVFRDGRNRPHVGMVGSQMLAGQFLAFCRGIVPTRARVRPMHSIYSARLICTYAIEVIRVLYADCCVALPRKLLAARQILAS